MKYRAEIDGLRALAVVPVILFHAGFELFSGGFVGVDVFFVISGYLITTILIEDIGSKRFSLTSFYLRRVRRILPALIFMLMVAYLVSYFVFLPAAHKVVGQYVVASIFSASNIILYLKGNEYFGLESGNNPLFHTWSLGVEEQFYIFFPVFLLIVTRVAKERVLFFVIAVALISFYLSEVGWRNKPMASFYLPYTRAWELLSGSVAAFVIKERGVQKNEALSLLGLAAIVLSIFAYDESIPFPSAYALVPVLGVVLLILFADKETLVARVLGAKMLVGIGLISYSAYLWHLPLQVYYEYLFEDSVVTLLGYFCTLILIAYVSYRWIEVPFRRKFGTKIVITLIVVSASVLSMLGIWGHLNGGYPERNEIFSSLEHNNGWGLDCNGNTVVSKSCSDSINPHTAVLGNSYAMTWVDSLRNNSSSGIVQLTQDGCAIGFVDEVQDINSISCRQFYEKSVQTILDASSIGTVIISSPFTRELSEEIYSESFNDLLLMIKAMRVIVIGPTPRAPIDVGECLAKNAIFNSNSLCDFAVSHEHHDKVSELSKFLSNKENVTFIDITEIICPDDLCLMRPNENVFMYIDTGHLSKSGASFVYSRLGVEF